MFVFQATGESKRDIPRPVLEARLRGLSSTSKELDSCALAEVFEIAPSSERARLHRARSIIARWMNA